MGSAVIARRIAMVRPLGLSLAVGAFMALTGAFGSFEQPFLSRLGRMEVYALAGLCIGAASHWVAGRLGAHAADRLRHGLANAALMCLPIAFLVWAIDNHGSFSAASYADFPAYVLVSFMFCGGMNALFFVAAAKVRSALAPSVASGFSERLPAPFRAATLWSVRAEDHYLRVSTSRGTTLVAMRFRDALADLSGEDGAQVHRSWWVASVSVARAKRFDGRATLRLVDGTTAPVSRRYARALRKRGWL